MAEEPISVKTLFRQDPVHCQKIREKFREVFSYDAALDDTVLAQRFSVTSEGDLVMKLQ